MYPKYKKYLNEEFANYSEGNEDNNRQFLVARETRKLLVVQLTG